AWEDEVAADIAAVRKTEVSPAGADYLHGRLHVHQRRWAEAAALFEHARTLLGSQPDLAVQVNLYLGQCYEQLEEPSQMLSAYQRVVELDPDSVQALVGLATAEWAMQRLDNASERYRQLIAQQRMPAKGWLDVARLEIQRQYQADKPRWDGVEGLIDA